MTKDVISLSISVLLLFRHYISHKITFGAPSSGGVLCSACDAFILQNFLLFFSLILCFLLFTMLIFFLTNGIKGLICLSLLYSNG